MDKATVLAALDSISSMGMGTPSGYSNRERAGSEGCKKRRSKRLAQKAARKRHRK